MITVEHLTKRYGEFTAVNDLSFEIEEGHVYGFLGLDPLQIIEIRDLIKQLGEEHTVILSSHILSEVQAICEKVLIISKGRLAAFDEPENLEKLMTASSAAAFTAEAGADEIEEIMEEIEDIAGWQVKELEGGKVYVEAQTESGDVADICRSIFFAFAGRNKALLEFTSKKMNLEDVFIELTESGVEEE